jgi:hypothetical protein
MTKSDGKYPNKKDLEPKVAGVTNSDELPLADPADSNTWDVFRKNVQETTGENDQSAYGANKPNASYNNPNPDNHFPGGIGEHDRKFNQQSHDKWNKEKPNENPFKP